MAKKKNKNIVLCSDGTGNKGGKGNDSNVFKLYQAVDLHNTEIEQLSFYDNGVGTKEDGSAVKSNKIWVALSGAFGLGFQDKVRDLYEFLARHYQAGDKIFIFGFSRGAATVRAFTGFINCCGLLDISKVETEKEFQYLINKAIIAYQQHKSNPQLALDFKNDHAVTDKTHAPNANLQIHFLGVWDTVSALGFPDGTWRTSDLFFDGLDLLAKALKQVTDKFAPHQFYDYELNDNVIYACQALAIDDERKTFHPKIWDESQRKPGSVEQVWFAGAHSNVGGGYPRSGLSDVALAWIYNKATANNDLVFINDDVKAVESHANVQGKLYDSRDGLGVYYRYEPRQIEQLCRGDQPEKTKIATGKIKIHNTVIERIKQGTSLYAPGYLPEQFEIVETNSEKIKPVSFEHQACCECRDDVNHWVDKRQMLYRRYVEITFLMLVSTLVLWAFPPESVKEFLLIESTQNLSVCQAFKDGLVQCIPNEFSWLPFQDTLYSILIYIFPVIFKNFIIFVVCIHPYIWIPLLAILVWIIYLRGQYKKEQSKAFAKTRLLLLETLDKT